MCKFCKLTTTKINEQIGCETIITIKDGSQIFELFLNRYIYNDENINKHDLILEQDVRLQDGEIYPVKSKKINIKYCPFCGEKL